MKTAIALIVLVAAASAAVAGPSTCTTRCYGNTCTTTCY